MDPRLSPKDPNILLEGLYGKLHEGKAYSRHPGSLYRVFVHLGFHFGKGVVATLGLVLFTEPLCALLLAVVFIGLVATTKYRSLGSIICAMLYPVVLDRIYPWAHHTAAVPIIPTLTAFVSMIIVVAMHRENIQRLMKGKENKFSFKKSVPPSEAADTSEHDA